MMRLKAAGSFSAGTMAACLSVRLEIERRGGAARRAGNLHAGLVGIAHTADGRARSNRDT
mgnify:CR=1 FL=1